ncbi:sulfite exporter TauE/SafE family protein [Xanthomonas sp. MUS 060]|uniref:sulfite exporter TauE/SafE family protein n=1 Tax=Xanthomonas sp. MUS 060 TaxID=1588031 RepID=UPI0012698CA1|nr:sulfite exporter TauE/SafE family protein [Xanthomonas sp. MUS 060]
MELRPRIGQVIARRVAHGGVTISDATFDTLMACFSDEQDSAFCHALWTGRLVEIALRQSPNFWADWISQRLTTLADGTHAAIAAQVLRTLREQQASLQLETIDTLSEALGWNEFDHAQCDQAWLDDARKTVRRQGQQERIERRRAALAPDGDAAVLSDELQRAHWRNMTPYDAAQLMARVVGPPSRWSCFLSALLPARSAWMYRFCYIVKEWFPDGLPASLQPQHVRFWTQAGNPRRPHGWQLAIGLTRGLALAPLIAVGAVLMLPLVGVATTSWIFGILGTSLAIWSALVLVQMAARWQARTTLSNRGKRIVHCWALPAASIGMLAGMRSGVWGAAIGIVLAYIAAFRMIGHMDADSRKALMPLLIIVGPIGALFVLAAEGGPWPGTVFALLMWAISLIQEPQHQRLQGHQ